MTSIFIYKNQIFTGYYKFYKFSRKRRTNVVLPCTVLKLGRTEHFLYAAQHWFENHSVWESALTVNFIFGNNVSLCKYIQTARCEWSRLLLTPIWQLAHLFEQSSILALTRRRGSTGTGWLGVTLLHAAVTLTGVVALLLSRWGVVPPLVRPAAVTFPRSFSGQTFGWRVSEWIWRMAPTNEEKK